METKSSSQSFANLAMLSLAILIGIALRILFLQDQILLDDEWHSLFYVPGKSLRELLHPVFGANSIPVNLYHALLLHTVGWSEIGIRSLSILAGILSLLIFPRVIRKNFDAHTTVVFTFFIAISPFLIFYSRNARPYAMVCFLTFFAMMKLFHWSQSRKKSDGFHFVWSGVAAVFFSITALPTLSATLFVILIHEILMGAKKKDLSTLKSFLLFFGLWLLLCLTLYLPSIQSGDWFTWATDGTQRLTRVAFGKFQALWSGTSQPFLVIFFLAGVWLGLATVFQKNRLLFAIFFAVLFTNILSMFAVTQDYQFSALVVTRYVMVLFPIGALLLAAAFSLLRNSQVRAFLELSFLLALIAFGPLPHLYKRPNNFMNHSVYQARYKAPDKSMSYQSDVSPNKRITASDVPKFYKQIARDPEIARIIEYPMFLGDHENLFYYFQLFHQKNVLIGYIPLKKSQTKIDFVTVRDIPDYVLKEIPNKDALKFRTLVDISDIQNAKTSGADYLIFHKNSLKGLKPGKMGGETVANPAQGGPAYYRSTLGEPAYEDDLIVAFDLR